MEKAGSATDETVNMINDDGPNLSKLTAMNTSELFRLAAELGLAIESVPSSTSHELRLNRYIE